MTNQTKLAGKLLNIERERKRDICSSQIVYIPFTYIMCTYDYGYYYNYNDYYDILVLCVYFLQFVFFYR